MFNNELWQKPAGGGGGAAFYTHQIANSCRFIASANSHMYRTQGTPTNVDKCTISVWLKRSELGAFQRGFTGSGSASAGDYTQINFGGDGGTADEFYYLQNENSPVTVRLESTALYRDPSAWMHLVIAQDSTQGTDSNRNKIYFNGVQYTDWGDYSTYSTLNSNFLMNSSGHTIFVGSAGDSGGASALGFDGYIAEYVFIDGTQNAVTDFGESKNGVWIPKDPSGLTFGNNGCYLNFADSAALGNDVSGNNNDFTLSAVSAHDQMLDSPTFSSTDGNGGNFATINPLNTGSNNTLSEGNLKVVSSSGGCTALGTMSLITGHKWYFEGKCTGSGNNWIGIIEENDYTNSANTNSSIAGSASFNTYLYAHNGLIYYGSSSTATGATFTTNDIMGVLVDLESGTNTIQFYKNGAAQGSAFNLTGTGINYTPMSDRGSGSGNGFWYNFGQEGSFGTGSGGGNSDATGYGSFYYDDGAAAKALCTGNLPTADDIDPAQTDDDYPQKLFNTKLYTGTGSSNALTGLGFKPDWTWVKERGGTNDYKLTDSTRGVTKALESNTTAIQETDANGLTAFGTDGFTVGSDAVYNNSSDTYLGWNWRANGGTTASGSGDLTSTQQVDPSGGFSIVNAVGDGGSGEKTISHGLSATPTVILAKNRDAAYNWDTYFSEGVTAGSSIRLNTTGASLTGRWGTINSSIFTVKDNYTWDGTNNFIYYCFTNIEGYIKSGIYEGNGNVDGSFVYCGFRPAWIMTRSADSTSDWQIFDNKRAGYNVDNNELQANDSAAEATTDMIDILSNGFKLRIATDPNVAETYIYLAFAENPFQYATAR